jgi:hypothetical protein
MGSEVHEDQIGRAEEVGQLQAVLTGVLARLDELGMFQAGAHLAMSIHALDLLIWEARIGQLEGARGEQP